MTSNVHTNFLIVPPDFAASRIQVADTPELNVMSSAFFIQVHQ
jgi:hypothetical protein